MKATHKKVLVPDVMVEAMRDEKFQYYLRGASLRLRLANEIYSAREAKGLSQQALAKNIFSTQKVISRIENGDVNVGIEMFDRLSEELDFNTDNLLNVFNHIELNKKIEFRLSEKQSVNRVFRGSAWNNVVTRSEDILSSLMSGLNVVHS